MLHFMSITINISHFYFLEHNLSSEQRLVGAKCATILFQTFPLAGLYVKVTRKDGSEEELQYDTIGDIGSVEEYADITLVPREDIDEEELERAFAGKIWCLCLYAWLEHVVSQLLSYILLLHRLHDIKGVFEWRDTCQNPQEECKQEGW